MTFTKAHAAAYEDLARRGYRMTRTVHGYHVEYVADTTADESRCVCLGVATRPENAVAHLLAAGWPTSRTLVVNCPECDL